MRYKEPRRRRPSKQPRRQGEHRRSGKSAEPKRVRVTSRTKAGAVWAGSFSSDVSEETLQAVDALADAVAAMTPEELESWRQKIKEDDFRGSTKGPR